MGRKNGQILLITLLVLLVLGIIIVGIVIFTNRDFEQASSNQKYDEVYNSADTRIKMVVSQFGDYNKSLTLLTTSFPECIEVVGDIEYTCNFNDTSSGNLDLTNVVTVKNVKIVEDYEIRKDESLEINLNNYMGRVNLTWDKDAALDFTILLRDASNNYSVVKDVFDLSGVYSSLVADDPYTDPSNIHSFDFRVLDSANPSKSLTINVANSIPAGLMPISMRITPRMNDQYGSIILDLNPSDSSTFAYQIREFISTSYDPEDDSSPVVKLVTRIPIYPQTDAIFDYALITEGAISTE